MKLPWDIMLFCFLTVFFLFGEMFEDMWHWLKKKIRPPEEDFEEQHLNAGFHLGGRSETLPKAEVLKRAGSQLNTASRQAPHAATEAIRDQGLDD